MGVHTRDAEEDSMRVFREELPRDKFMREVLDLFPNAVIGISGVVAMKYVLDSVRQLVLHIPLDRLVIETDAPFLSGLPREIPSVARAVARIRGISTADVLAATSAN